MPAFSTMLGVAAIGAMAYGGAAMATTQAEKKKANIANDQAGAMRGLSAIGAAPTAGVATEAEKARIRKKSKTILTGPLSGDEFAGGPTLLGSGDTTKKVVLGG